MFKKNFGIDRYYETPPAYGDMDSDMDNKPRSISLKPEEILCEADMKKQSTSVKPKKYISRVKMPTYSVRIVNRRPLRRLNPPTIFKDINKQVNTIEWGPSSEAQTSRQSATCDDRGSVQESENVKIVQLLTDSTDRAERVDFDDFLRAISLMRLDGGGPMQERRRSRRNKKISTPRSSARRPLPHRPETGPSYPKRKPQKVQPYRRTQKRQRSLSSGDDAPSMSNRLPCKCQAKKTTKTRSPAPPKTKKSCCSRKDSSDADTSQTLAEDDCRPMVVVAVCPKCKRRRPMRNTWRVPIQRSPSSGDDSEGPARSPTTESPDLSASSFLSNETLAKGYRRLSPMEQTSPHSPSSRLSTPSPTTSYRSGSVSSDSSDPEERCPSHDDRMKRLCLQRVFVVNGRVRCIRTGLATTRATSM